MVSVSIIVAGVNVEIFIGVAIALGVMLVEEGVNIGLVSNVFVSTDDGFDKSDSKGVLVHPVIMMKRMRFTENIMENLATRLRKYGRGDNKLFVKVVQSWFRFFIFVPVPARSSSAAVAGLQTAPQ